MGTLKRAFNKPYLLKASVFLIGLASLLAFNWVILTFSTSGTFLPRPLFLGLLGVAFLLLFSLNQKLTFRSFQRIILFLTIVSGFLGPVVLSINLGPFHLFPYRILLLFLWAIFFIGFILQKNSIVFKDLKVYPYLIFLAVWFFYATLSLLWSADKPAALVDIIFLFMAFSLIFLSVYFLSDLGGVQGFFFIWLLMFGVLVLVGLWEIKTGQHFSISRLAQSAHLNRRFAPSAFFRNENDLATVLTLGLPFVLVSVRYYRNVLIRFVSLSFLSLGFYVLIRTYSRANYVAVLMGLFFWFLFLLERKGKVKAFLVVVLLACLFFAILPGETLNLFKLAGGQLSTLASCFLGQTYQRSLNVRLNLFKNALIFLVRSYGLGVGAGNSSFYMANYQVYDTQGLLPLHSWFLSILTDYGLLILLGYLFFYIMLFRHLFYRWKNLKNLPEKAISEGLLVGLVSFVFASMSSSSIIALKPHWLFFAFALAFLNYCLNLGKEKATR